jgi:Cys-tRNA(Pro) deacylase
MPPSEPDPTRPELPALRRARPEDATAIAALVEEAYRHYVPRIGRVPGPMMADHARAIAEHEVWVLEDAGTIIGVLELIDRDDHLWIENVAVTPTRQGQSLGRGLLDHAEDEAIRRGHEELRLLTNEHMVENLAMYERRGFHATGREPRDGTTLVHFAKALPAATAPAATASLEAAGIPHRVVRTRPARSPEESAELQGIPLGSLLRTLVVRRGQDDYLFVLVPGGRRFDWPKLRAHLGVKRMTMPDADEAKTVTGYERGAITPFGASHAWPVFADASVLAHDTVAIGGGARGVNVHLSSRALIEHVGAEVVEVSTPNTSD